MYSESKNIKPANSLYLFLDRFIIVKSTDLVRQTVYSDSSDYVSHLEISRLNWQLVSDFIPVLIGKTIDDFEKQIGYSLNLEIIREIKETI